MLFSTWMSPLELLSELLLENLKLLLKYFSHCWSWESNKSVIKDRGVNLYGNDPEKSINFRQFWIKETSTIWCSVMLCASQWWFAAIHILLWCSYLICEALGVIHCSVSTLSLIVCSVALLISVLLDVSTVWIYPWLDKKNEIISLALAELLSNHNSYK